MVVAKRFILLAIFLGICSIAVLQKSLLFSNSKINELGSARSSTGVSESDNVFSSLLTRDYEQAKHDSVESKYKDVFVRKRKKFIIIAASARTGSSFFGEFFNQNEDVFYQYEPAHPFYNIENLRENRTKALKEIANCNFGNLYAIYKHAVVNAPKIPDQSSRCAYDGVCFGFRSAAIQRDKLLCNESHSCRGPFDLNIVEKVCNKANVVVAKLIAVLYIKHLEALLELEDVDVKIIHLVRDPRGIVSSRLQQIQSGVRKGTSSAVKDVQKYIQSQSKYVCNQYKTNTVFTRGISEMNQDNILKFKSPFAEIQNCKSEADCKRKKLWRENYLLVRYEDVSLRPFEAVNAIYEFINENVPEKVMKWLKENTSVEMEMSERDKVYSLSKNSSELVDSWRRTLPPDSIKVIESACDEVMRYYNYKFSINY